MDLSIVAPAFDEAPVLPLFIGRVLGILDQIEGSAELILVDDGSKDGTWEAIEAAARVDERIRGLRLSRNFGHQAALTAGLAFADGDAVITLDADLQHPPEVILELLAKARDGYDVVCAVRSPTNGMPNPFNTRASGCDRE